MKLSVPTVVINEQQQHVTCTSQAHKMQVCAWSGEPLLEMRVWVLGVGKQGVGGRGKKGGGVYLSG